MKFYKVTLAEANLIGKFGSNPMFDPFVSEQQDGHYIIMEDKYLELKNTEEFLRIDFSNKTLLDISELNTKESDI